MTRHRVTLLGLRGFRAYVPRMRRRARRARRKCAVSVGRSTHVLALPQCFTKSGSAAARHRFPPTAGTNPGSHDDRQTDRADRDQNRSFVERHQGLLDRKKLHSAPPHGERRSPDFEET
jgi:hypothetical protein